jgi:hypothetical protein
VAILIIGTAIGYWFIESGVIHSAIVQFSGAPIIASFFAGFFFTSIFTTAPAIAALFEICQQTPVALVALFGGLGSVCGDFIIFRYIQDDVSEDISFLFGKKKYTRLFHVFHTRLFEWSLPFLGAIVIASPLPDELGLTLLGFSKVKRGQFFLISFVFNSIGIVLIGLVAKGILF